MELLYFITAGMLRSRIRVPKFEESEIGNGIKKVLTVRERGSTLSGSLSFHNHLFSRLLHKIIVYSSGQKSLRSSTKTYISFRNQTLANRWLKYKNFLWSLNAPYFSSFRSLWKQDSLVWSLLLRKESKLSIFSITSEKVKRCKSLFKMKHYMLTHVMLQESEREPDFSK